MKVNSRFYSLPNSGWRQVFFWLCFFKVIYWAVILVVVELWGDFESVSVFHWPPMVSPTFVSHFATFDAFFYLKISEVGYEAGQYECAVLPLWPLLIRWFSQLTHGSPLVVGLILANTLSITAWIWFYKIVLDRWGTNIAAWSLTWLVAFPGSLFYQFLYSESLFLLLLVGLWWALERRMWRRAAALAFLLPLTRAIGVYCILPVAWYVVAACSPRRLKYWREPAAGVSGVPLVVSSSSEVSPRQTENNPFEGARVWLLLLASPCGWLCYLALMHHWTGNPLEIFASQRYFGVHYVSNLWDIPKFIMSFFAAETWHEYKGSLLDRSIFLLLISCLLTIWRLDRGLFVWSIVLGVIPAMSSNFTSLTRYMSVTFPLFIALAMIFGAGERRWFRYYLLISCVVLHMLLVWRFVNFRWAG